MKKNLITIKIKRTEKGVLLYLKSGIIEDFVKAQSNGETRESRKYLKDTLSPSNYIYIRFGITNMNLGGSKSAVFDCYGDSDLYYNSGITVVNLSFLRVVGLSKGVQFHIQRLYSEEYIKTWLETATEACKHIYNQYLKKVDCKVSIMINEYERVA